MTIHNTHKNLFLMVLILGTILTTPALAHEPDATTTGNTHHGIILGINIGGGHSVFGSKEGSRSILDDGKKGGIGGLRVGYSFSNSFALTLEGFGIGIDKCDGDEQNEDTGFGGAFLAMTWHPGGHGFFLRTGLGGGGGDFHHPVSGDKISIDDRAAFLFSMGYDWRLGKSLTLGFSLDSMILDAGNTVGPGDDFLGASGLTVQFNWYL